MIDENSFSSIHVKCVTNTNTHTTHTIQTHTHTHLQTHTHTHAHTHTRKQKDLAGRNVDTAMCFTYCLLMQTLPVKVEGKDFWKREYSYYIVTALGNGG